MRRLWRKFASGDAQQPDRELRETDPARFGALEATRRAADRAAAIFAVTVLACAVGVTLAALYAGDTGLNIMLGVAGTAFGLTATAWWTARGARQADSQRVVDLASGIFLQQSDDLRKIIEPHALDGILKNLLITTLPDKELGESLWRQGFGTLAHRVRDNRWRSGQRYDVKLRERTEPLQVSLPDAETLDLAPGEWRELSAQLSYERSFESEPRHVWVGLVFDPAQAPDWFEAKEFLLREYMPLEQEMIDHICAAAPGPRVLEEANRKTLRPREVGAALAARRRRAERLRFAVELSQPKASVDGTQLDPDEVAVDERGMAVRFALPERLRRELKAKRRAQVLAGLTFPLPHRVSVFPVYFPDLTREGKIVFDHREAAVSEVTTDMFFAVYRPYWKERVAEDEECRIVETDQGEWIFPGAGMVFSWRNMFPRP
jgi:hypothetical protein